MSSHDSLLPTDPSLVPNNLDVELLKDLVAPDPSSPALQPFNNQSDFPSEAAELRQARREKLSYLRKLCPHEVHLLRRFYRRKNRKRPLASCQDMCLWVEKSPKRMVRWMSYLLRRESMAEAEKRFTSSNEYNREIVGTPAKKLAHARHMLSKEYGLKLPSTGTPREISPVDAEESEESNMPRRPSIRLRVTTEIGRGAFVIGYTPPPPKQHIVRRDKQFGQYIVRLGEESSLRTCVTIKAGEDISYDEEMVGKGEAESEAGMEQKMEDGSEEGPEDDS